MLVNKLTRIISLSLIFLVVGILIFANFTPGTWLTGWDNLHPEFNLALNIKRAFYAVWQEYQGVGLTGGMAHAADLPRLLILSLVSVFLPDSFLRYFWTFLMLIVGPLGVYFLSFDFLKNKGLENKLASFTASMFYLFNLATVQTFFTPFETFTSFFGFLPWLLFFCTRYLRKNDGVRALTILIVSVLATAAFYVQTMFVVYLMILSVFILESIVRERVWGFLRSVKLLLVIFVANAFWLLPVIYFSLTNSSILDQSKINFIATPETLAMNQARGTYGDISLMKGYWFDYYDFRSDGTYDYLYLDWINYLSTPGVEGMAKYLLALSAFGMLLAVFSKSTKWRLSGLIFLALGYVMLATVNPPTGGIYSFFSRTIPLFETMFRNVFTKWSQAFALAISLGLAMLVGVLGSKLKGKLKLILFIPVIYIVSAIVIVAWPVFGGKLISPRMRSDIPGEYFNLISYFSREPEEGRIAFFPIHTFWGWNYYQWGYGGSGFSWYGIKQPFLDRAFDVWSGENESFYQQIDTALKGNDTVSFNGTLKKYGVRYLLFDSSVINPNGTGSMPSMDEGRSMAETLGYAKSFQDNFLTVYVTPYGRESVYSLSRAGAVDADLTYARKDSLVAQGDYFFLPDGITYPFVNLDTRNATDIKVENDRVHLISNNLNFAETKELSFVPEESDLVRLSTVFINPDKQVEVVFPKINAVVEEFTPEQGYPSGRNCDLKEKGVAIKQRIDHGVAYKAGNGGVSCDYFYYPTLDYSQAYILHIKGRNLSGRSLKIYLQNLITNRLELTELLPTGVFEENYIVYPNIYDGPGYTLSVETRAFGNISSENVITDIEFIPLPLNWLESLRLDSESNTTYMSDIVVTSVNKDNLSKYTLSLTGNGIFALNQGYDQGWRAYKVNSKYQPWFFGKELKHLKVNSWENGWLMDESECLQNSCLVKIVFWPQYLEYLGFGLLAVSVPALYFLSRKRHTR